MTVELALEEVEVLREVLSHHISEMDVEVLRTDTHDYKEMLKHRRAVLERVLARREAAPVQR